MFYESMNCGEDLAIQKGWIMCQQFERWRKGFRLYQVPYRRALCK